jgi:TRAP-type uncharacterized transport system substrate-binding protein
MMGQRVSLCVYALTALLCTIFFTGVNERQGYAQTQKRLAKPDSISIDSWSPGTRTFTVVNGLAKGIRAATGVKTHAVPVAAERDRFAVAKVGEIDISVPVISTVPPVLKGSGGYEAWGPQRIRQIFFGHRFWWATFAAGRTGVKTWQEAAEKGLRAPTFPGDPGFDLVCKSITHAYGIQNKINWVPVGSIKDSWVALVEGTIDIAFGGGPPQLLEVQSQTDFHVLPLPGPEDVEFWDRVRKYYPLLLNPYLLKPGDVDLSWDLRKAGEDYLWTLPDGIMAIAWEQLPVNKVYWFLKGCVEGYAHFKDIHPTLKRDYTLEKFLPTDPVPIPWHDGAALFYKESGIWTAEHEALQKKFLAQEVSRMSGKK